MIRLLQRRFPEFDASDEAALRALSHDGLSALADAFSDLATVTEMRAALQS